MTFDQLVQEAISLVLVNLDQASREFDQQDGQVSNDTLDNLQHGLDLLQTAVNEIQIRFDRLDDDIKSDYRVECIDMIRQLVSAESHARQFISAARRINQQELSGPSLSGPSLLEFCESVVKLEDPRG